MRKLSTGGAVVKESKIKVKTMSTSEKPSEPIKQRVKLNYRHCEQY